MWAVWTYAPFQSPAARPFDGRACDVSRLGEDPFGGRACDVSRLGEDPFDVCAFNGDTLSILSKCVRIVVSQSALSRDTDMPALWSLEKMFVKLALRPRRHDADAETLP
jgi:hypothetical protein